MALRRTISCLLLAAGCAACAHAASLPDKPDGSRQEPSSDEAALKAAVATVLDENSPEADRIAALRMADGLARDVDCWKDERDVLLRILSSDNPPPTLLATCARCLARLHRSARTCWTEALGDLERVAASLPSAGKNAVIDVAIGIRRYCEDRAKGTRPPMVSDASILAGSLGRVVDLHVAPPSVVMALSARNTDVPSIQETRLPPMRAASPVDTIPSTEGIAATPSLGIVGQFQPPAASGAGQAASQSPLLGPFVAWTAPVPAGLDKAIEATPGFHAPGLHLPVSALATDVFKAAGAADEISVFATGELRDSLAADASAAATEKDWPAARSIYLEMIHLFPESGPSSMEGLLRTFAAEEKMEKVTETHGSRLFAYLRSRAATPELLETADFVLCEALVKDGDLARAKVAVAEFERQYPTSARYSEAELLEGMIAANSSDTDKALQIFGRLASAGTPEIAEKALFLTGWTHLLRQDYPKARSAFEDLLKRFPKGTQAEKAQELLERLPR